MGCKGRETRQTIMRVVLEMPEHRSYKVLTVAGVAPAAGVASSTFYVHFEGIEDVLFACVEGVALDLDPLRRRIRDERNQGDLETQVRNFVETYNPCNPLWNKHRVELRVADLEADQVNPRFPNTRAGTTGAILHSLGRKIAQWTPAQAFPAGRYRHPRGDGHPRRAARDRYDRAHAPDAQAVGCGNREAAMHRAMGLIPRHRR